MKINLPSKLKTACHVTFSIDKPWLMAADRFGLLRSRYHVQTRDGAVFQLRGGTSDGYVMYEVGIRRDYHGFVKIKEGDVIIDIGANIGIFTVLAARLAGPAGRIVAVEPNSETFQCLKRNILLNNLTNVTAVHAAIMGENRTTALYISDKASTSTVCLVVDGAAKSEGRVEQVRGLRLEVLLDEQRIDRVDVLKIDCEGAEYEVFDRTDERVWGCVSEILMETHQISGRSSSEITSTLGRLGYVVRQAGSLVHARRH